MSAEHVAYEFQSGNLDDQNMDQTESSVASFIPNDLLDIICILERDEKHLSYKIIRNCSVFSLVAKFRAKNAESTPLNSLSVQQPASYQDKK